MLFTKNESMNEYNKKLYDPFKGNKTTQRQFSITLLGLCNVCQEIVTASPAINEQKVIHINLPGSVFFRQCLIKDQCYLGVRDRPCSIIHFAYGCGIWFVKNRNLFLKNV